MKTGALHKTVLYILFVFTLSCGKDVDQFIPDPEVSYTGDISHFFEQVRVNPTQTMSINIDFPTAVVTPRKTVLIFQPKSLLDANGVEATGQVKIHVTELLTRGEILLYGIPTHSHGKLLASGGEFYVTATQDDVPLHLKPEAPVRILTDVSGTPQQRMELFYDGTDTDDQGKPFDTWDEADRNPNTWDNVAVTEWVALADSQQIITGFGYECFSDSLNWINFDVFENIPANLRTNVTVTLPDEYGNVNTAVYLIFHDRHSVINLPGDPSTRTFSNFYRQSRRLSVPVGANVSFLAISEQEDGAYYYAKTKATLEEDHNVFMLPVRMELDQIRTEILKL